MKWIRALSIALAATVLGYLMLLSVASLRQGYAWTDMDWDQKGHTSFKDFLAASDIGRQDVDMGGKHCTQYFSYKDGLPIKTVCP
jgi:hypothetical protein